MPSITAKTSNAAAGTAAVPFLFVDYGFYDIAFTPLVVSYTSSIVSKYYIIYCCIIACIAVTVYFLFPETLGHSLEEMSRVFDGNSTTKLPPVDDGKSDVVEARQIDDA